MRAHISAIWALHSLFIHLCTLLFLYAKLPTTNRIVYCVILLHQFSHSSSRTYKSESNCLPLCVHFYEFYIYMYVDKYICLSSSSISFEFEWHDQWNEMSVVARSLYAWCRNSLRAEVNCLQAEHNCTL